MSVQLIQDSKGKTTGVFIPINDWNKLKNKNLEMIDVTYEEPSKKQLLQELKEAITELKLIEQGKLKAALLKNC